MKKFILITIIFLSLINSFDIKAQSEKDPYWEFNEKTHFRPKIDKVDFYKLEGYEFGSKLFKLLSNFLEKNKYYAGRGQSLSYAQKALFYWLILDTSVLNGGFDSVYYNFNGKYVQTVIKGLQHVGDKKMANLIKRADEIYQERSNPKSNHSQVIDPYNTLDKLDKKYYQIHKNTMSLIEDYIRKNPFEICLDEDGKEFDPIYTGTLKSYYDDKKIKDEINLEGGLAHGVIKTFYQNENLKEQIHFLKGEKTGERKEFYEDGQLKFQATLNPSNGSLKQKWYYSDGNPEKLESKLLIENKLIGEFKNWCENGQLSDSGNYNPANKPDGEWLKFYPDGSKWQENEYVNNTRKRKNCWNKKGEQILINGTGIFIDESSFNSVTTRYEIAYVDFIRHGKYKEFRNEILTNDKEWRDGKLDGVSREFYRKGNLKEETIYENGNIVSSKRFPKFENPIVKTAVISNIYKTSYDNNYDYKLPDNEPKLINGLAFEKEFENDIMIFGPYGDEYVRSPSFTLFVTKFGYVSNIEKSGFGQKALDEKLAASVMNLKFEPALKNGEAIKSIHKVRFRFILTE